MQRAQQQRAAALAALAALLLVGSFQLAAASRDLLQTSGTCIAQIPNCETGRCSTATVAGALSSVCARCKSGFIASDSGLNCSEWPAGQKQAAGQQHSSRRTHWVRPPRTPRARR